MKPISLAYSYINEMGIIIENGEQKYKAENLEIEKDLFAKIKALNDALKEVERDVGEFRENDMIRRAPQYTK
jgi:hypothetical protein